MGEERSLVDRIDAMILQNDSRQAIASFILEKRSKINQYTLQEVADETFTSKSTLVRFAQSLGFKGWREFTAAYIEETSHKDSFFSDIDPNIPFTATDSYKDIVSKISSLEVESILDTADLIKEKTMAQAVDRLLDARQIVIIGLSPNTLAAELFRRKMLTIGIIVTIPRMDECGAFASAMTEEDCVIMISYAGNQENRSPMKYLSILEHNNVPMIGITSDSHNYIRDHIDCVFSMSSRERLYSKISGFTTEMSLITILNALFSCVFAKDYEKNWTYKKDTFSVLEEDRNATIHEMRENEKK